MSSIFAVLFLFVLKVLGEIFDKPLPETVIRISDNQQHAANLLHRAFNFVQIIDDGMIEFVGALSRYQVEHLFKIRAAGLVQFFYDLEIILDDETQRLGKIKALFFPEILNKVTLVTSEPILKPLISQASAIRTHGFPCACRVRVPRKTSWAAPL